MTKAMRRRWRNCPPTSLVFGAWDSRDTQVKIPRLVDSTIRAFQVEPVSRNGQYSATLRKSELQEMGIDAEALGKDVPAAEGLVDNPVKLVPGGVIAHGGIRRDAVLNLIPLRALDAESADKTLALRRYVLGLGLLALFAPADLYLRQGCILVANRQREGKRELVSRQGRARCVQRVLRGHRGVCLGRSRSLRRWSRYRRGLPTGPGAGKASRKVIQKGGEGQGGQVTEAPCRSCTSQSASWPGSSMARSGRPRRHV